MLSRMSPRQRLVSAFIVFHILAITVTAIPAPDAVVPEYRSGQASLTFLGRTLGPVADATVAPLRAFQVAAWSATQTLRAIARPYILATRQFELWNMFSRPSRYDEYIALRYYVAAPGSSLLRVQRELVSPAHGEGGTRLLNPPSDAFRDKAIALFIESYFDKAQRERARNRSELTERPQEILFPIVNAFARRFKATGISAGEALVRTELWRGTAPIPPPGQVSPTEALDERRRALEAFQSHVDVDFVPSDRVLPLGAVVHEADLTWVLMAEVDSK
jgi:hypothetical protein